MSIDVDIDFSRAREHLEREAIRLVRDSAATAQETAQREAPVDTGTLRRMIELGLTGTGADVRSMTSYGIFIERGTGLYATGGGGRKTPWVYERDGRFYTTSGAPAQPYMKPGFLAGVDYFFRERRRRGFT